LAKFQQAHRATAAVMTKKPDDPNVIIAHAQSEYWVGYGKQKNTDAKGAIASYQRYLALAKRAVEKGLPKDKGQREQGWAFNAMGVVQFEQLKDNDQAIASFDQYRMIFERLAQKQPRDTEILYSLADAHAWLAQVASKKGNFAKAGAARQLQINILERLFAIDPKNDQPFWARIGAERELFRICFRQKDYGCAKTSIARAKQLLKSKDFDEANRDWLWQSAYVAIDSGFLADKIGTRKEVAVALEEAKQFSARYQLVSEGDSGEIRILNETTIALEKKLN
jgi:tetratricopeptide (TPR) repeat protein